MRFWSVLAIVAAGVGFTHPAAALTLNYDVAGTARPYDVSANPLLSFNEGGSTAPTVIDGSSFSFATGSQFSFGYVSGFTQTVSFYGPSYVAGYSNIGGNGPGEPGFYVKEPTYLQAILGAFVDDAGMVIGSPFAVDVTATYSAPEKATRLLLGINDNFYSDNLGSITLSVTETSAISAVPLPTSAPMFGAALLGLGLAGRGLRRRKAA